MQTKINYTKEQLKSKGVYAIQNVQSGKYYVGSTSQSFQIRWRNHKTDLKKNRHHNKHLQNSFNLHGDVFVFEILQYCDEQSFSDLWKIEDYWINKLNSYEEGYNLSPYSNDTERIRRAGLKCKKAIVQYDLQGNFIKEWSSFREAKRLLNFSIQNKSTKSGKVWYANGFQWSYKSDNFPLIIPAYEKATSFKIAVYDRYTGKFLKTYSSILDCSTELNLNVGNITRHIRGDYRYVNDYVILKYDTDYPEKVEPTFRQHSLQKSYKVTNILTKETFYFTSGNNANQYGFDDKYLRIGAETKKVFRRHQSYYISEFISFEECLKQINNA